MLPINFITTIFKDKLTAYIVVAGFLFGTAYFTYLGSRNNAEVANKLEVFSARVNASERDIDLLKGTDRDNRERIIKLEANYISILEAQKETNRKIEDFTKLFIKIQ